MFNCDIAESLAEKRAGIAELGRLFAHAPRAGVGDGELRNLHSLFASS
jgi:hypothetical protein